MTTTNRTRVLSLADASSREAVALKIMHRAYDNLDEARERSIRQPANLTARQDFERLQFAARVAVDQHRAAAKAVEEFGQLEG